MPLPANNTVWPPKQLEAITPKLNEWAAWYESNTDSLTTVYTKQPANVRRGVIGAVKRFFWGDTRTDLTKPAERKLHVPAAADLCKASSDLLFNEPPTVTVDHEETQGRVEELTGPDFHDALANAAETTAALGGSFLRITWDVELEDHPFLTHVDYDAALPEFRFGRLVAVTFWRVVKTDGQIVYRHLERHETINGIGVIFHGLYQGTPTNLGQIIPLADHASTAGLEVDEEGKISTESEGLAVFHWPNMGPNRSWRKDPLGQYLGRSDLDGLEPLFDALDEAYTSLMRDVRLGKAMLVVPNTLLNNNGPGAGASFGQDEIYSGVNAPPGSAADSKLSIEQIQFDIRVQEHEQTIKIIWDQIIKSAGYSAQTFGDGGDVAVTATEVFAKERRSGLTQGRKGRALRPVLESIVKKLLAVDNLVFGSGNDLTKPVEVELADGVKDDPEALARTAQLLGTALAASIDTRVRMVNPNKDEDWITEEVERIKAENQLDSLTDPDTLGLDGEGLSEQFGVENGDATE